MIGILRSMPPKRQVETYDIPKTYAIFKVRALLGVFIGYAAYYLVRNNFLLSTPYLMKALSLHKTDIGIISSCLLITYGISKGVMSSIADKCNPKYYMICGLLLSCVVNVFLGFSTAYWMFVVLVILNGIFQGMGAAPSFITLATWYPRLERGRALSVWSISHNVGGGIVAPIAVGAFAIFGADHWQIASYWVPAAAAMLLALAVAFAGVGTPYNEGLPSLDKIDNAEADYELIRTRDGHKPEDQSAFQIFCTYVLYNKNVWYISIVDSLIYVVRFGSITWLPIYLLQQKGFSPKNMSLAFLIFEWAAIPSTLFAGILTDKLFKGRRMPLAMISMTIILAAIIVYWQSRSLVIIITACGFVGALIYIPQFLASVTTVEIVPSFAVGSAVGLRGFMSYVVGSTIGTALFGKLVDLYGWNAGFALLLTASVLCILFCYLSHRGTLLLEAESVSV